MNTEEIIINVLTFLAGWVLKRPQEIASWLLRKKK
jgi:hypothetical protein